jgi:hypothetical protein
MSSNFQLPTSKFKVQAQGFTKFQFGLVVVATDFVYDLVNSTKAIEDMIYPILETDGVAVDGRYISTQLSLLKAELQNLYFNGR